MRKLTITSKLTNRETMSFKQYLKEVSMIELLTPEEELLLTSRTEKGDEDAIAELVEKNLRFVISVAKKHSSQLNPLEDLVNEGNIGLIIAARKFNRSECVDKNGTPMKFISYAVWWIRKVVMEYLAKHGRMVRLPANKINSLSKLDKRVNELEQRETRSIDVYEIFEEFGVSMNITKENLEVLDVLNTYSMDSLDREVGTEDGVGSCLGDLISDDSVFGNSFKPTDHLIDDNHIRKEIDRVLDTLKPRDKGVMISLYGLDGNLPKTLEVVGGEIGLTREMVRQIKVKTLAKLKGKLNNSVLKYSC